MSSTITTTNEKTHFKVGSRKSKLAMVQTERYTIRVWAKIET